MSPTLPISDALLDQVHDLTLACAAGEATPEQIALLDSLVCSDDRACQIYVRAMLDGSTLRRWAATLSRDAASADMAESFDDELMPVACAPAPGRGFVFLGGPVSGAMAYSSQSILFSYLIATVLVGCGLFIGSIIPVSQTLQTAHDSEAPNTPAATTVAARVGCITGVVDCVWERLGDSGQGAAVSEDNLPSSARGRGAGREGGMHLQSSVHLNDRFALRSGLLEITYDAGARVILQGPVSYEVDSAAGGRLSLGKLTARLEKRSGNASSLPSPARGRGAVGESGSQPNTDSDHNQPQPALTLAISRKRERESHAPLATLHSPLFTITTPTAIVTDLGTEFGVDVAESGTTETHVFSGTVKVVGRLHVGIAPQRILLAGDVARLVPDAKVVEMVDNARREFVRALPRTETTPEPELIGQVDYSDSWTANSPTRAGSYLLLNDPVALQVEQCHGNPSRTWVFSRLSAMTTWPYDNSPVPWPGHKVQGSKSGFTESGFGPDIYFGFEYGLRKDFVVQFDGVQTDDRMNITIGDQPATIYGERVFSVFVRAAGSKLKFPEIGVYTASNGEADSGLKSGIVSPWQWHNYAVRFNLQEKKLTVWVDRQLRGEIDLVKIARGTGNKGGVAWASLPLSNRFVTIGGCRLDVRIRVWTDNFLVGSPRESVVPMVPTAKSSVSPKVD